MYERNIDTRYMNSPINTNEIYKNEERENMLLSYSADGATKVNSPQQKRWTYDIENAKQYSVGL